MKVLQKVTLVIALITLFASCQTSTDIKQVLSKSDTRKEIMDTIANNSNMSKEVMRIMMNNKIGQMLILENEKIAKKMLENHITIIKIMKDNPGLTQCMLSDMMETCKSDSSMMASMCKTIIGNPQLMNMMQKMNEMDNMERMDHKTEKKADNKLHH
ncbi:MAG: hypothetical protein EO766_08965 [Hydrotalea sp. AMD]|uniref:hypothetical protein n=1 Tax=Hydrotalea sp. AMD TaxID=2501297 RepID=UPI0009456F3E|nr:hypothetical protein [Hydrotalea sp. AMD]RTL47554.1 MAG: hypothetical protein EKK39_14070 [Sphingobacteriales bacterium]RWZ88113.1 MAG: hypothetical protein EO766_08965 [Hydrotalea sp. AMD]